jgi:hypothetical protein
MQIPLIIPNFNQLHYLVNLINWWNYYTGSAPVYVVDNKSTYNPLLKFYNGMHFDNVKVLMYAENNCGENLMQLITSQIHPKYNFYCISNPDIMPHPGTPENFLQLFRYCIEEKGYHHAGFQLKIDDLPWYIDNRDMVMQNEKKFWHSERKIIFEKHIYGAQMASIDLTFCMYSTENGGWQWPKDKKNWGNSLRILEAFHLGWYISPDTRIDDHLNYFKTCLNKNHDPNAPLRKGENNYKPNKFKK